MALNSPADLFLWELSGTYDAERKSGQLLGEAVGQVPDGGAAAQLLRIEEQETREKLRNLDACFQELSTSPRDVACLTVDGMRAEYQAFRNEQPAPEVLEMYVLGAAMKMAHFGMAGYRGLVDKAMLLGEIRCAQILQTNLVGKQDSAGRLERFGHETSLRVLATA
jgi:ferritin-like metal-binding protein YciE